MQGYVQSAFMQDFFFILHSLQQPLHIPMW